MNNWWQETEDRELLENRRWFEGDESRLEYFFKKEYNQFKQGQGSPFEVLNLQRKFWKNTGGKIPRVHSGLPKLITKTKVNLITSNGFNVEGDETAVARLWDILETNDFSKVWQGVETDVSWAGRGLFRIYHDFGDVVPSVEKVSPESFKILIKRGKIYGIEFSSRKDEVEIIEKLELEDGIVKIEYKKLIHELNKVYEVELDDDFAEYLTELPFLPFELVNNTVVNSRFPESPYGESDYTGVQSLFQTLDALISHAQLEITNAKAIKFVNERVIKKDQDGNGVWDENEITIELANKDMENFDVDKQIKLFQPNIRVAEYDKLSNDTKAQVLAIVGISPVSTGLPGFESITASAGSQREREKASIRTRQEALERRRTIFNRFFNKLLKYDDFINGREIGDYEFNVLFSEWSIPTLDDKIDTIGKALQSGAMDTLTAVQEVFPDKDELEIGKIVLNIKMERGVPLFPEDYTRAGMNAPQLVGINE